MTTAHRVCVYCGAGGPLTKDHIPPKSLFSIPRPELITVPACAACNTGASKDDEYFRLALSLRHDVADHPEVRRILPVVFKSLERRRHYGFTQGFLRNFSKVEVKTPAGFYLGTAPAYNVKLRRLDRVAERVTTGLFFHEFGRPLPADFRAISYSESGLAQVPAAAIDDVKRMCSVLTSKPPKMVGANVFSYWFKEATDRQNVSAWLLTFYGRVRFSASRCRLRP